MYSLITSAMTWSYSRITAFEQCPYKFFLTYIQPCEQIQMFFSDFGSFIHEILASFYKGKLQQNELVPYYLENFQNRVRGVSPSAEIFKNYFRQGLTYLKTVRLPESKILGVERYVKFTVEGLPFVGFVDLILEDAEDRLIICDHKSHGLKQRSSKGKYTKSDAELDSYLRQLYLYSIPIQKTYGRYPDRLVFNCYRAGYTIEEPYSMEALKSAKEWAVSAIDKINREENWLPNIEYYQCKYLCGVHRSCEYYMS